METSELPLVGISADLKDREHRIEIIVGGRPESHITHTINTPKRVWFKPADLVALEAIGVESEDGTTTIVSFRRIPPEETDRQLPEETEEPAT